MSVNMVPCFIFLCTASHGNAEPDLNMVREREMMQPWLTCQRWIYWSNLNCSSSRDLDISGLLSEITAVNQIRIDVSCPPNYHHLCVKPLCWPRTGSRGSKVVFHLPSDARQRSCLTALPQLRNICFFQGDSSQLLPVPPVSFVQCQWVLKKQQTVDKGTVGGNFKAPQWNSFKLLWENL